MKDERRYELADGRVVSETELRGLYEAEKRRFKDGKKCPFNSRAGCMLDDCAFYQDFDYFNGPFGCCFAGGERVPIFGVRVVNLL